MSRTPSSLARGTLTGINTGNKRRTCAGRQTPRINDQIAVLEIHMQLHANLANLRGPSPHLAPISLLLPPLETQSIVPRSKLSPDLFKSRAASLYHELASLSHACPPFTLRPSPRSIDADRRPAFVWGVLPAFSRRLEPPSTRSLDVHSTSEAQKLSCAGEDPTAFCGQAQETAFPAAAASVLQTFS